MPGEVAAALEALVSGLQVLRIEVVQVAEHASRRSADAGIRRHVSVVRPIDLAAETTDVGALLEVVDVVVAGPGCQRQRAGDQIEIHRAESRFLLVAACNVVEKHVPGGPDVRVVRRDGQE